MSKYKIDLDYAVYDVDISEEDIKSIIEEADGLILKEKNTEPIILAEAYLKKAQCLQKLNKFIESEDPIIKALKIVPDMPEALIRLGNVYDIEEKHDQAVECFKRGLGINNNYAYGFRMLGLAYDNMNDFKNAQTYYKKAMSKKKDYKLAIEEYAFCCIKLEDYDHAIEYFTKLIEIDQHNVQGYIGRGMAYAELKKLNEAISDFTTSIKIKSDTKFYIIVYRSRGEIFKKLKKYDEAIADFSQIIRLRENDPDAYVSRGEIFFWEENYDKALGDFSKAIDLEPTEYVYCYRARTYAKKKDYEKAIIDFTMAENINNSFVGLYKYRAIMYSQMKEYDKAIKDYSKAINIGQDICNYCRRGLEYHNKGEYNKAIDDFSHVIKNKSNCEEVFENRANTYHTIKNFDKAIDDYSKAFNIEQNSCFLCKRSDVFLGKQDMNKAIDDLTGAIKLRPKCNALYSKRGYVYCQLEKYPKAISDFTKAQEIEPDDAGNYYYRAQAFLMQKNYDAALVDTNKVFELCENNIKPKYYFLRGYIFYRMNDLKLSLLDSTKATNIDPNDVEYRRFFVHISHKIFINDIDLYYDFKVEELLNMPHFFIKKIALLKQAGKTTEKYKKLIKSISSVQNKRLKKPNS
jgi:tetratricopeptide (TPR) repeat protein